MHAPGPDEHLNDRGLLLPSPQAAKNLLLLDTLKELRSQIGISKRQGQAWLLGELTSPYFVNSLLMDG